MFTLHNFVLFFEPKLRDTTYIRGLSDATSAWDNISQEIVRKSLLKTGISSNFDGREMITCGMNVNKEGVKKRMLMNTYIPLSRDTDEDVAQEQLKKLFCNSEEEEENDFEGVYMLSRGG